MKTGKLSFPTGLRVSADFGITKIISKFYILHDNEVEKMKLFFSFLIKNKKKNNMHFVIWCLEFSPFWNKAVI